MADQQPISGVVRTLAGRRTPPERKPRPTLFDSTGVLYPHLGHLRKGRDPRMAEYLSVLRHAAQIGEHTGVIEGHEQLLWVLCAGIWWLTAVQAVELAAVLDAMLSNELTE